jgi:hypothetical protein
LGTQGDPHLVSKLPAFLPFAFHRLGAVRRGEGYATGAKV